MLTQLRADAGQQYGEAERFGDVIVGAGFEPENRIAVGIVAGQHDDRCLEAVLAQNAHRLAAIDIRQPDIHKHQIDLPAFGGLHAFGAGIGGDSFEFLVQRQLLDQGLAQLGVVIDDQNGPLVRHRS